MKVRVTDDCDGFARCVALAPEVFTTPEEPRFRTEVIRPEIDEEAEEELASRAIAAIQQCPKRALRTDLDAALRTAVFVVVAVAMRPVGGALSDRFHGGWVLVISNVVTGLMAAAATERMPLIGIEGGGFYPVGTAVFLTMGASLGIASGAVFALVAQLVEPSAVGSVTGVVGAVGGLGGFVPPLLLGWFWTAHGNYRLGLFLLFVLAILTAAATWFWFLRGRRGSTDEAAPDTSASGTSAPATGSQEGTPA